MKHLNTYFGNLAYFRSLSCATSVANCKWIELDRTFRFPEMYRDRLVPVPLESLSALQQMYRRDWPQHEIVYNWLGNYIEWSRIDRKLKDIFVFSLNDTWRENGTFVILDGYQLFFHTLDHSNDTLTRALRLVDWDCSWKISGCYPRHRSSVLETIEKHNLQLQYDFCTEIWYLAKEKAQKFDVTISHDLQLRPLTMKDAVKANSLWPYRTNGSEFLLKRLALWNPSVGLFDKTTGEMVAWCFRLQSGAHGILRVSEGHQRKGYGTIVVKALAKKLAELDFNSYAFVHTTNDPSRQMFQKLGFQIIGTMYWTRNEARGACNNTVSTADESAEIHTPSNHRLRTNISSIESIQTFE